ncbi:KAT8 regulatory NSL complex subunit 1-like protein isoform X2 [Brachyhypopomus gauderio]|uniref:KAT8 regulatory NSL complex subunit 1-like protein isoform X2 n=1 Tax=Brachyhypopomus gauderio TaxID=698409 RepID=UPI00404182D7
MDSSSASLDVDLEPQAKGLGRCYAHDLWLNLSSLPFLPSLSFLDSCQKSSEGPLELTDILLPSLFHNKESYKSTFLSSPGSLLGLLSLSRNCMDSPVPPEYSCDLHFPFLEDQSTPSQTFQSPSHDLPRSPRRGDHLESLGYLDNGTQLARPSAVPPGTHHPGSDRPSRHLPWPSSWPAGLVSPQEAEKGGAERCACRQAVLEARVSCASRRLHALLGDSAVRHCARQLEGLGRWLDRQGRTLGSTPLPGAPTTPIDTEMQEGHGACGGGHGCSTVPGSPCGVRVGGEVWSLALRGQALLRRAQEALDSDATDSSSDEEWESDERTRSGAASGCLGCEWSWQCDRAQLASCWTWLQLRLSELDIRLQQIRDLHQHILASKARVVLALSQPPTDRQIQQTLVRETVGLTWTAGGAHTQSPEPDMEPSSPTRLLRNIQRQSAQLSLMVNSLMAPLSTSPSSSPVSKDTCVHWTDQQKRPFNSTPLTDALLHATSTCSPGYKRRRLCGRRQRPLQVDATCVSARTRPLLTYHKPRLFFMSQSSHRQQGLKCPACLCAGSVSGAPLRACSHPTCSCSATSSLSTAHPMAPPSSDSSLPLCAHAALGREDWLQRPWADPPELATTSHSRGPAEKAPSSFLNCTHQLQAGTNANHRRLGPAHWGHARQESSRPPHSRGLKRRHHRQADKDRCLTRPGKLSPGPADSAEDGFRAHSTLQRSAQFPVRRRNGESVYNIDNIIIPVSLAACSKVDTLRYKDVLTPSWRLVNIVPLVKEEEEVQEDNMVEVLSDEAFSRRHQDCERREKLRWNYWRKGRRYRHTGRFPSTDCFEGPGGDRPAGVHGDDPVCSGRCWPCGAPLQEDGEAQMPWTRRTFPLYEEDVDTPRCDEDDKAAQPFMSERRDLESRMWESRGENWVGSPCYTLTTPPAGCAGKDTHRAQGWLR